LKTVVASKAKIGSPEIAARARLFRQIHATGARRARRAGNKAQIRHIDANREQAETFSGRIAPIRRIKPRNNEPANEGGPVSRQGRGISVNLAVLIFPEN
jgi:hypothetical protein